MDNIDFKLIFSESNIDYRTFIEKIGGEANIDKFDINDKTPLLAALENQNTFIALKLIENGANVNLSSDDNITYPIHLASRFGLSEVVQAMVSKDVNVNIVDKYGIMPLHYASGSNAETVKILLDAGANPNYIVEEDYCLPTALHVACYYQNLEAVAILLDWEETDTTIINKRAKTAKYIAEKKRYNDIVELFNKYEKSMKCEDHNANFEDIDVGILG